MQQRHFLSRSLKWTGGGSIGTRTCINRIRSSSCTGFQNAPDVKYFSTSCNNGNDTTNWDPLRIRKITNAIYSTSRAPVSPPLQSAFLYTTCTHACASHGYNNCDNHCKTPIGRTSHSNYNGTNEPQSIQKLYYSKTTICPFLKDDDPTNSYRFVHVDDTTEKETSSFENMECNNYDNTENNNKNHNKRSIQIKSSPSSSSSSSIRGISTTKIYSILHTLQSIPIGFLHDVHFREACKALNSMAHFNVIIDEKYQGDATDHSENSIKEWSDKTRGDLAWMIFKRLLIEIGCDYDKTLDKIQICGESKESTTTNTMKHPYIDSIMFHDTIKCMAKSKDPTLIHQADDILQQLEQHHLLQQQQQKQTKSKIVAQPIGRSYALLFDAIKDVNVIPDDSEFIQRVEQIMGRVEKQQNEGGRNGNTHSQVKINSHLINSALNALAVRAEHTHNPAVSRLVRQMVSNATGVQLDHVSYSIAIKSLLSTNKWLDVIDYHDNNNINDAKSGDTSGITTAKAIESLFVQMQERGLGNPNVKTMTPILQSLSKDGNANEISNLIEWMEEMYNTWGWEDIRPNNYHFNTMITALARKTSNDKVRAGSGHLAFEILNKMKTLYEDGGNESVRPDLITYNAILHCISKEENSQGTKKVKSNIGDRALALLRRMEDGEEGDHISPDIFSYNATLAAIMNSATFDAASKTQNLLQHMTSKDVQPDLKSYTICINTLSKSRAKGSSQKAEDLLRVLEEAYAKGNEELKPDVKCYNSVIHAWVNSNERDAVQRAHKILTEMQSLRKSGERPDLIPDAVSFTSIVSALAKDSIRGNVKERMLDAMFSILKDDDGKEIKLDSVAYNALIHAQSNQSGSADKAEKLLDFMLEQGSNSTIRPNVITFNTVLNAISKSKEKDAASRAERILNKMQRMYEQGCDDVRPDTLSFASVLNAYANSAERGSAEKAEKILKHMQLLHKNGNDSVVPNTICFATVIKAYSRSRRFGAAQKAEDILRLMFQVREDGNSDVEPNTIAFTSVCDAWSKSNADDAIDRVESLIEWMKKLSDNGYRDVFPNEYTYNCLLTAIARSKDPNKANKSVRVLRYIQADPKLSENIFIFNNVLLACAYTHGTSSQRFNAIKVAVGIMEEVIEQKISDDRLNVTFGIFFQACANLTLNETEKANIQNLVETVFYKCCERGQVDEKLLLQLRKACTQQLYLKLFGDYKSFPRIQVKDIPQEWKANVTKVRSSR